MPKTWCEFIPTRMIRAYHCRHDQSFVGNVYPLRILVGFAACVTSLRSKVYDLLSPGLQHVFSCVEILNLFWETT